MRAALLGLVMFLPACTYEIVFVKTVGEGCSSVSVGQATTDASGDATGTAAGGGGGFISRLERAWASDDRCPAAAETGDEGGA